MLRRFSRFRLRLLFAAVAVACLALGWARSYLDYADRRWDALSKLGHNPPWNNAQLVGPSWAQEALRWAIGWRRANVLLARVHDGGISARGPLIADAELDPLEYVPELESLRLWHVRLAEDGFRRLGRLRNIKNLEIIYCEVSGDGLQYLRGMTQLEKLDLSATNLTDAGLAHLPPLPALKVLILNKTAVTGAGLERFHSLPALTVVHVLDRGLWGPHGELRVE